VTLKPLLLGPGTADYFLTDEDGNHDTARQTTYATFNNNLLAVLAVLGFKAPKDFIWSHHNYNDASYDMGRDTTFPPAKVANECPWINRAWYTRQLMYGRWTGGPYGDANDPYIFITEGGIHREPKRWATTWDLDNSNVSWNAKHGFLMQRQLDRMQAEAEGKGVGMVSQFLFYSAKNYDSGICDPAGVDFPAPPSPADGAKREPAYTIWANAESYPNVE
jgi:hypothetical protein